MTPYQAGIVSNLIRLGKHIFHYIHSFIHGSISAPGI